MTHIAEAFCRDIPKVELHAHLLGTVRHATFRELAHRAKAPLGADEIDAFYLRGEKPTGVLKALRALDAWLLRTPDDLHRIAYEYLQDASAHNVRHAEFFWNPTGTAIQSRISYSLALEAIVRAVRDARADFGIIGRLIPSIDREASPRAATEMVEWVVGRPRDEVVGIGIDYSEVDRPPELFVDAYAAARRGGLKTTAHAGEFGMPWTNVRTAIELLKVDRIDHGYTVVDAPVYARECGERGIVFTVVPTNSYYLRTLAKDRWALDHPIRKMPGLSLRIHPNTDDPTLHGVTPTQAWLKMIEEFDFSVADLRSFMMNGLDAAWFDETTRREWKATHGEEFDRLARRLPDMAAPMGSDESI